MKAIDLLTVLIFCGTLLFVVLTYSSTPDTIPIHYGINGKADGFGSKINLWFLLLIQAILLAGIYLLRRRAKSKAAEALTAEKGETRSELTKRSDLYLSVICLVVVLIFTIALVMSALSVTQVSPILFLVLFLAPIATVYFFIFYLAKSV